MFNKPFEKPIKIRGNLEMTFTQFVKNLHREESGQDLLEYALVLAAVLTAVVAGSASLASDISTALTTINTKIQNAVA
jgi:pilus assembly protein Flp/PilA